MAVDPYCEYCRRSTSAYGCYRHAMKPIPRVLEVNLAREHIRALEEQVATLERENERLQGINRDRSPYCGVGYKYAVLRDEHLKVCDRRPQKSVGRKLWDILTMHPDARTRGGIHERRGLALAPAA